MLDGAALSVRLAVRTSFTLTLLVAEVVVTLAASRLGCPLECALDETVVSDDQIDVLGVPGGDPELLDRLGLDLLCGFVSQDLAANLVSAVLGVRHAVEHELTERPPATGVAGDGVERRVGLDLDLVGRSEWVALRPVLHFVLVPCVLDLSLGDHLKGDGLEDGTVLPGYLLAGDRVNDLQVSGYLCIECCCAHEVSPNSCS